MSAALDLHAFRVGTLVLSDTERAALRSLGREASCEASTEAVVNALASGDEKAMKRASEGPQSTGLAALAALAVDWARCRVPLSACTSTLEEAGFPPARAASVAASCAAAAEATRARLAAHAPLAVLPRVTGLTWRLDYGVTSKAAGRAAAPMFIVDLHLAPPADAVCAADSSALVQTFSCTPAELDELRLKVRDALTAAEALASSVPA